MCDFNRLYRAFHTTFFACVLVAGSLTSAKASEPRSIDIPAQALDAALLAVGDAFGVNVVASEELTSGVTSEALSGELTLEAALEQLLSDTSLGFEQAPNGTYIVRQRPSQRPSQSLATPIPDRRIEEIVVRGEKSDRSLQDTLSSVAVLEGEVIDASFITELGQILQRTTNVATTEGGFSIRGVPERGVGSGTGDTSQTSAVYVDGAVQSQFGSNSGIVSAWDIDQVEVFRGAQTTTQGRAALGGAIIVNTTDPSFEWEGRTRIAAGEFGTRQYAAAVGGPIIEDTLAFRISVDSNETDGFTEFLTPNGEVLDDIGAVERDLLRGKLLLRFSDATEAVLSATYSEGLEGSNGINGPDPSERRNTQLINIRETEVASFALNVTHRINDSLTLTSITSYSDLELAFSPIEETLGAEGIAQVGNATDETVTQELRLNFDAGSGMRGIAGLYYNQFDEFSQRTLSGIFLGSAFVRDDGYNNDFTNYALFGEGEFDFGEHWSVTLGARYDVEDSTRDEFARTVVDPPIPLLPPNSETNFSGDASFDAFLPKVGLTYKFDDEISLSAIYQRAYRPGGADIREDTNEPIEFDPEYTNNYELAFRALLFDGSLTLNANAFYIDYTDMQIRFVPNPDEILPARFIANAGEAEIYGLEVESLWRPSTRLSLYASLGWADSELGEFLFQGDNLEGNQLPNQPNFNASFGGSYEFAPGFLVTVDNIYSDTTFSATVNSDANETDSYIFTNVRLGYSTTHWGVSLFGQNVFDELYFLTSARTPEGEFAGGSLGQPQTFGLIFEASL